MTYPELEHQLADELRQSGLFVSPAMERAFYAVPRHHFVPFVDPVIAYQDKSIPIMPDEDGVAQSICPNPSMLIHSINQLALQEGMNVLEIGTGSAYSTALLANLVGPSGRIVSLEINHDLANLAREKLRHLGLHQVHVIQLDAYEGYAPYAPYDAIFSSAGVWDIPSPWLEQAKEHAHILVPLWLDGVQVSACFQWTPDGLLSVDNDTTAYVYLRGEWQAPILRKRIPSTSIQLWADGIMTMDLAALYQTLLQDAEKGFLGFNLSEQELWNGFQLFAMLNEPEHTIFSMYMVVDGVRTFGLEGIGIALFSKGSACFVDYQSGGSVRYFGSADTYLELVDLLQQWQDAGRPMVKDLKCQLYPKKTGVPVVEHGKLYDRRDHYVHVWMS